jgi:hypothetical protein
MPKAKKASAKKAATENTGPQPDMEFIGSTEEGVHRSIASRQKLRNQVDDQVAAFLNKGGAIDEIEPNVMADPPRKPTSNYGSRPI